MKIVTYKNVLFYIGKNAQENWDLLDFSKKINKKFIWFHLDSFPSGYVIMHSTIEDIKKHNICKETCKVTCEVTCKVTCDTCDTCKVICNTCLNNNNQEYSIKCNNFKLCNKCNKNYQCDNCKTCNECKEKSYYENYGTIEEYLQYGANLCKENTKYRNLKNIYVIYTSLDKLHKSSFIGEVNINGKYDKIKT